MESEQYADIVVSETKIYAVRLKRLHLHLFLIRYLLLEGGTTGLYLSYTSTSMRYTTFVFGN